MARVTVVMVVGWVACGLPARAWGQGRSGPAVGATTSTTAPAKPPAPTFNIGQMVEVKWGSAWREAIVKNKGNGWTLVNYGKNTSLFEWVEPWRIRKPGASADSLGHVMPGKMLLKPAPPPKEKPAPIPGTSDPAGGAAATDDPVKTTDVDFSAMRTVKPEADAPAAWSLAPDPAPAPPRPPSTELIPLKHADGPWFDDSTPLLIAPAAATAVLLRPPELSTPSTRLERINLVARTSTVMVIPAKVIASDVSADGERLLTIEEGASSPESQRLDVWKIDGSRAAHVISFRPYASRGHFERNPTWARFLAEGRVATLNNAGRLIVWDLAGAKAVWEAEVSRYATPAVSPGGRYVAAVTNRYIVILDVASGATLARRALETQGGSLFFSPEGKQLAQLASSSLRLWSVESGTPIIVGAVAGPFGFTVDWLSDGYLLMDGTYLVDASIPMVVWKYDRPGGANLIVHAQYAGRFWHVTAPPLGAGKSARPMLASVVLPHDEAKRAAKNVDAEEVFDVRPGAKVSLEVNNMPAPDAEKARAALAKALADNGCVVADGQPIRLVATIESGKTIEMRYHSFGARRGEESKQSVTQRLAKLTLIGPDGQPLWNRQAVYGAPPFLMLKDGQTIEQALAEFAQPPSGFFTSPQIPQLVPKTKYKQGLGTSLVTERGVTAAAAPNTKKP